MEGPTVCFRRPEAVMDQKMTVGLALALAPRERIEFSSGYV